MRLLSKIVLMEETGDIFLFNYQNHSKRILTLLKMAIVIYVSLVKSVFVELARKSKMK